VTFDNVVETPLLSINRDFSAPIIVTVGRSPQELERLAQTDTDAFARYEAMQELLMGALVAGAEGRDVDYEPVIRAVAATLQSNSLEAAFKAEAILLPSEGLIAGGGNYGAHDRLIDRAGAQDQSRHRYSGRAQRQLRRPKPHQRFRMTPQATRAPELPVGCVA